MVNNLDKAAAGSLTPAQAQIGACINMGNHLEAPVEGAWGRKLVASDFTDIAKAGFQTIRLPVKWSAYADPNPPYTVDPAFFKRIDEVLNQAIYGARLRVILDFHHYDELNADPSAHKERFVAIWRQVAARYKSWGYKLWFELLNEPGNPGGLINNDNLNSIMDPALAAIRETNPTRIVVYSGASGGTVWPLYGLKLPKDPNLVVSVHDYTSTSFTGQAWGKGIGYAGPTLPFTAANEAAIQDRVNVVKGYITSTGRPVLLGEYGVSEAVPVEERAKYHSFVSKAYAKIKVSSCAWSYTAGGMALRDKDGVWQTAILKAIGL